MKRNRHRLLDAMQAHQIPQIIVGYLKIQQAAAHDFYTLFLDQKINGRLFYNTCLPGAKEIKFGNEDFMHTDLTDALVEMLQPFTNLSLLAVHEEIDKPTALSIQMQQALQSFLTHIETSAEWKHFWEKEINLQCSDTEKKFLYHTIAGAAAYKAFITCINTTSSITNPEIKRNIALLVKHCSGNYKSIFVNPDKAFKINAASSPVLFKRKRHVKRKPRLVEINAM